MNLDNLVRDLKIIISTWDKRSKYKQCLEMFLRDKTMAYKEHKDVKMKTTNIKKNDVVNLRHQARSQLRKGYSPVLPSTYIRGKRKQTPEPISIVGQLRVDDKDKIITQSDIIILDSKADETYDLISDKEESHDIVEESNTPKNMQECTTAVSLSKNEQPVPIQNRFDVLAKHRDSDLAKRNSEGISNDSKTGSTEAVVLLKDIVKNSDLNLTPNSDRTMDNVVRNKDEFLPKVKTTNDNGEVRTRHSTRTKKRNKKYDTFHDVPNNKPKSSCVMNNGRCSTKGNLENCSSCDNYACGSHRS